MVGANWGGGGRGAGCVGWLLVGKDSDAVHGDLPEKPGPGGPQHQPGVSPSRADDKAMSQKRRKGLDWGTPDTNHDQACRPGVRGRSHKELVGWEPWRRKPKPTPP